jgi:hypothetical protein
MSKRVGSYQGAGTLVSKRTPSFFSGEISELPNHQPPPPRTAAEQAELDKFAKERAGPQQRIVRRKNEAKR